MKNETPTFPAWRAVAVACLLMLTAGGVRAQASAPLALPDLPASAASSPGVGPRTPPGPRLRSPAETGNRATAPGDLRPERPVTPQISVPLGRKQPASEGDTRPTRRQAAPAIGGIDDAAARCEAQEDDRSRATCRARAARESKVRPAAN